MSVKHVRNFKESRKLSYQTMSVLAMEFLRVRGLLNRYAKWLNRLGESDVRCFMDSHRDEVMPEGRRKRAERKSRPTPLLDLIERSGDLDAPLMGSPEITRISPALRRRLAELRAKPSYEPVPGDEPEHEPEPKRNS